MYIPIALNRDGQGFQACNVWINKALSQHTGRELNITMVLDLNTIKENDVMKKDSIYIGGGNTYKLLDLIRQSGFDSLLVKYLDHGGSVYGGSAGAIVMGTDISTVEEEKDREIDPAGLNLIRDFSVECHAKEDDIEKIQQHCRKSGQKVLALPEGSGVIYSNNEFTVAGGNIFIVSGDSFKKIEEGSKF